MNSFITAWDKEEIPSLAITSKVKQSNHTSEPLEAITQTGPLPQNVYKWCCQEIDFSGNLTTFTEHLFTLRNDIVTLS